MNFDLNEKEIDGYVITEKVKKIWAVELDMLKILDCICKKYNLKYYACYGTLLGAVRHKGFIPWDDDIDVFMMRDDYTTLLQVAPTEIGEPYFFQNVYTDAMVWAFSKIRDSRTTAIEFPEMQESFNQGIFIDIFPIDTTDDGTPQMQMITKIKHDIWDCIFNRQAIFANLDNPDIWKIFAIDKTMVMELINMSYRDAMKCFEDFCLSNFDKTNRLRSWSSEVMGNLHKYYEKEWFSKTIDMPFCNTTIPVPIGYEKILEMEYGDWRIPVKRGCLHEGIVIDPDISYIEWLRNRQ